jgi:tetratricopeptide (TPR) repeat protein
MLYIIINTQLLYGSYCANFQLRVADIMRRPYDVRLWQAQGASYQEMGRLREAIECLKRALLGADANEIAIALKLARLHSDLDETADAVAYHRRVIDISRAMRMLHRHQSSVNLRRSLHRKTCGGVGSLCYVRCAILLCIGGGRPGAG